eukprot:6185924-Pleurochrysis_carterae.AAC.1
MAATVRATSMAATVRATNMALKGDHHGSDRRVPCHALRCRPWWSRAACIPAARGGQRSRGI